MLTLQSILEYTLPRNLSDSERYEIAICSLADYIKDNAGLFPTYTSYKKAKIAYFCLKAFEDLDFDIILYALRAMNSKLKEKPPK